MGIWGSAPDSNYPRAEDPVLSGLLSAVRVSFSNGGNFSPVRTQKSPPDEFFRWSATLLSLQGTPHLRAMQISSFPILYPLLQLCVESASSCRSHARVPSPSLPVTTQVSCQKTMTTTMITQMHLHAAKRNMYIANYVSEQDTLRYRPYQYNRLEHNGAAGLTLDHGAPRLGRRCSTRLKLPYLSQFLSDCSHSFFVSYLLLSNFALVPSKQRQRGNRRSCRASKMISPPSGRVRSSDHHQKMRHPPIDKINKGQQARLECRVATTNRVDFPNATSTTSHQAHHDISTFRKS